MPDFIRDADTRFWERRDAPRRTGDMAYRLLLDASEVPEDPGMKPILEDKAVTYWCRPGAHVGMIFP